MHLSVLLNKCKQSITSLSLLVGTTVAIRTLYTFSALVLYLLPKDNLFKDF